MGRVMVAVLVILMGWGWAVAVAAATEVATFAGGCFWCMEAVYDDLPGVIQVTSGFMGGKVPNPRYDDVARQGTGHAEVVQVVFDPDQISYSQLLDLFWRNVDPLDEYGQFCDRGNSYRSEIFVHSPEQQTLAEQSRQVIADYLAAKFHKPVVTAITPASTFYPAEAYHQGYHKTHPLRYRFYRQACGRDQRLQTLWQDFPGYSSSSPAVKSSSPRKASSSISIAPP
ncbi:MAG: peptide-methionine (S)-S-oxide reductase MsrA [Thermostichales cyanobacterium BF4_bins_65]